MPVVELKQVVFDNYTAVPEGSIWDANHFKSWTETSLGGNKCANGVIWTLH